MFSFPGRKRPSQRFCHNRSFFNVNRSSNTSKAEKRVSRSTEIKPPTSETSELLTKSQDGTISVLCRESQSLRIITCSCPRPKHLIQPELWLWTSAITRNSLSNPPTPFFPHPKISGLLQQLNHIQLLPKVRQHLPSHEPFIPAAPVLLSEKLRSSCWKTQGVVPGWFSSIQIMDLHCQC